MKNRKFTSTVRLGCEKNISLHAEKNNVSEKKICFHIHTNVKPNLENTLYIHKLK